MGRLRPVRPVKLFISLLTSLPRAAPQVEEELTARFGPVDLRSETYSFDSTSYYDRQMGVPLTRRFYAFADLISPSALGGIKRRANDLEECCAVVPAGVERPVNLDPGYLEESKVVLASTKNFYHRIYVGEGIYAEVTMHWEEHQWQMLPWTFPDFRTRRYDAFFSALRRLYRQQLADLSL